MSSNKLDVNSTVIRIFSFRVYNIFLSKEMNFTNT